jgi:hypothetical protein
MPESPITSVRLSIGRAEITLGRGRHVFGRASDCAVCLDDMQASRRHASMDVTAEGAVIRDLGSRNGVLVNGMEIEGPQPLYPGDLIVLGAAAIVVRRFERGGGVPAAAARHLPSPAEIGRVVVARRIPSDPALAEAVRMATTLSHSLTPLGRTVDAFRLIADAASAALAAQLVERALHILEAPLTEVLATLRAGIPVDREITETAVKQATALYEATADRRWVEYVTDVHDKLGEPIPPSIARRLASVPERLR